MLPNKNPSVVSEKQVIDWDLVLRRLRSFVFDPAHIDKARSLIERESIWKRLDPGRAVEWARLASVMGKYETALKVLDWVVHHNPSFVPAWEAKTAIMESLAVKASPTSTASSQGIRSPIEEEEVNSIVDPFSEVRISEHRIATYMNIFKGREDCFARQWINREKGEHGYIPVYRPLTEEDVQNHLTGKSTYGIYLMNPDSTVSVAVIDIDCDSRFRNAKSLSYQERKRLKEEAIYIIRRIPELAGSYSIPCFGEFSGGKGYHFWFSFERPVAAHLVRKALIAIVSKIARDVTCFKCEVFPKQDNLSGKGLGNLVKLPLGIHRVTGKPSFFLSVKDRSLDAQLDWLESVPRISPETLNMAVISIDPSVDSCFGNKEWAQGFPELATLSERCQALRRLIERCYSGEPITVREEKILLGTISFLPRGRLLTHSLLRNMSDYNPHLIDYKLSRVRGTPLGCKSIHRLLDMVHGLCRFGKMASYSHPLLHLPEWKEGEMDTAPVAERVRNLQEAIEMLKTAILAVERFLPGGPKVKGDVM